MGLTVDLTKFGIPNGKLKGTVISYNLTGKRLLLLFSERHTIRVGVKAHLLNALQLFDVGVISCVGVEGWKDPTCPVPCDLILELFHRHKVQHGDNEEAIIEGLLHDYQPHNYVFWKTLTLLRPTLPIQSVEDPNLFYKADFMMATTVQDRIEAIANVLRRSSLRNSQHTIEPMTPEQKETIIQYKSITQGMDEFAQADINYQRDEAFITNMRLLWDQNGPEKVAILNAGASHQYRIARQLQTIPTCRDEYSYVLIEQP
jgi:hypothetical protein